MARPSKKEERKEEILLAYERCIAKHGVEGATLQKIANEAGIARALLRHNVGNREDLLMEALERFIRRNNSSLDLFLDSIKSNFNSENFVEYLFSKNDSKEDVMIASAFIIAAQTNELVKKQMKQWFLNLRASFYRLFSTCFPFKEKEDLLAVTDGVIGVYFNIESLCSLGNIPGFEESSKKIIISLIKSLEVK